MNETMASVEPRDSPYFGLDYYDEKFGAWFFGRETEGGKIITNLRAARLTLLHAESGVGKSSLLRAGVAWRMRKLADDNLARRGTARSVPIVFSSWRDDPVLELTGAIRTAIHPYLAGSPEPVLPTDRLDVAIGAASGAVNANLLIMLDQFEEYFLYRSREPIPERFAYELARCVNRADLRANFLIAIREDAYASLGDLFKGRIANVYSNYLHVEYLDRASAEKAIREPLNIYNGQPDVPEHVKIQDELVEAVLDQVRAFDGNGDGGQARAAAGDGGGENRVATPLLQLVMETIWERERAEGSHELRLSTLHDLHGVKMIVDAHLTTALRALSGGERQIAIDMFEHLVTPSGGKIAESVPDLAQRTSHTETQAGSVLEKLDHERIVRPIPAAPGHDPMRYRRYEIFHDVLGSAINRTIEAREARRRARRTRLLGALAVSLLAVTLAVVGVFVYLWQSANTAKLTAESRQLAAEADVNAARDPELSVLLALRAMRLQSTSQAENALRTVLPELQAVRTFQVGTTGYAAVFDPVDRNKIASADRHGVVAIWDVKTGHRLMSMSLGGFGVAGAATAVAFNPTGTQVAVGYGDGKVALFDARSGGRLHLATIPGSPVVNEVAFMGGTGDLAIATGQGVNVWLPRDRSKCCYKVSSTPSYSIAVDPHDLLRFAVATSKGTVIWNLHGSGPKQRQLGWGNNDAAFSPDGSQVATADSDGNVRVYNAATSSEAMFLNAGEANVKTVAFSPDGRQIVAGYSSGRVRVWDISTRLQLTLLAGHAGSVRAAQFSANGSEVVTASDDGTIRVWHSRPSELRTESATSYAGAPSPVEAAAYISGSRIVALDSFSHLYVFTAAGKQQAVINPGSGVNAAAWNHAGTKIVTAGFDGKVDLWRAIGSSYRQVSLPSPIDLDGPVWGVDMSSDGSRIAIMTNDSYRPQVRSAQTGRLLHTLEAANALSAVVFRPGGRQILAGDYNGQIEVWDAATGHRLRVAGAPGPYIDYVQFNQTGSEFVTASNSGVVTVWSARDYRRLRSIDACPSPNTASFSPSGSKIVVACGDGSAPVFDAHTGKLLTVLPAASAGSVSSASFSPDGNRIVTSIDAGDTGGVQIWNSTLSNPQSSVLMRLAQERVTGKLTPEERQKYLTGISG